MFALLAMILTIDGGGTYTSLVNYEWPVPTCDGWPALIVSHNTLAQGPYGTIGATTLPLWDGGAIIDAHGLRGVRGPTNIFYHFTPTWSAASKYEVCFQAGWNPASEWVAGFDPTWNGTIYLIDLWDGSQHSAALIWGYVNAGDFLTRLQNPTGYVSLITTVETPANEDVCASVEWVGDGGSCDSWVRYDPCGYTPFAFCHASTIVMSTVASACPSEPTDVVLFNRAASYSAPTSAHLRRFTASRRDGGS